MSRLAPPLRLKDAIAPTCRRSTWLLGVGVLVLCAIPLLIDLGVRDSWHTMENITLASSQEVFLAMNGWHEIPQNPDAWIVPTWRGNPRLNKPPLAVWLNLLAWSDLTPATSTTRQLTWRARLASVGVGLVMLVGVFWLGLSVGNIHTACLATLAVGTTLLFERQARLASYDIHLAAFVTLAVAGAWWAMGPLRALGQPSTRRWLFGWLVCGLGWGAAVLSKGPLALALVILPIFLAMVIGRPCFKRSLLGLVLGIAVMLATAGPWYLYIFQNYEIAGGLAKEYRAARPEYQPLYYYLGLLGLVWPWTVYLIGGLSHPFGLVRGERKRQLLLAWSWFCLTFILFTIPEAKQQRYILPILPAVGLMVAALWQDHQRLSDQGQSDPGLNLVRVPHWIVLMGTSLLIVPFLMWQDWLIAKGWEDIARFGDISGAVLLPWALVLIGISYVGIKAHWTNKSLKAGYCTAVWALVFTTGILHAYAYGPKQQHPVHDEAARVVHQVNGAPLRYLRAGTHHTELNEEFVFYVRRIIPTIEPKDLEAYLAETASQSVCYILTLEADQASDVLLESGFERVLTANQDYHSNKMPTELWQYRTALKSE